MKKFDIKGKALRAAMAMLPSDMLDSFPDNVEEFVSAMLSQVELSEGEKPALLIIKGTAGYTVNVIRLDAELKMTIVNQFSLKEFSNTILNRIKDGDIG